MPQLMLVRGKRNVDFAEFPFSVLVEPILGIVGIGGEEFVDAVGLRDALDSFQHSPLRPRAFE